MNMSGIIRVSHRPTVPAWKSFPIRDYLSDGWDKAIRAIGGLISLRPNWDGENGRPVSLAKIASAVRFCHLMRDEYQWQAPSSVYPLSDGNIMIEWRYPSEVTVRFEVESVGCGEFMISHAPCSGKPPEFLDFTWGNETEVLHPMAWRTERDGLKNSVTLLRGEDKTFDCRVGKPLDKYRYLDTRESISIAETNFSFSA